MLTRLALQGAVVALGAAIAAFIAGIIADKLGIGPALVIFGVIAISSFSAGILAFRRVGNAVDEVEMATTRLAGGELTVRVTAEGTAASVLTRSFNRMAGELQSVFDARAAEHARLEAVFDAVADGILALDAKTAIRFLNPAAGMLLQVDPSIATGRPFIEHVRDFELDGLVREAIATSSAASRTVVFGQRRIPLRASVMPIRGGGEWALLVMVTDLTEERRADTIRREFVANVSHELRTPLASIRALAETIENGDVDSTELPEFTRRIQDQVERLTTLVNELLDLSRIESGAIALNPEPVRVLDLVRETVGTLAPRTPASRVHFEVSGDEEATVEGDRQGLARVLGNLLDNAMKFSPAGGAIWVHAATEPAGVLLTIRDEGPGIQPEDLPRVFERFYTGDRSRAGAGAGLGLAIVKHMVRAHNGAITVDSRPGHGATFSLRLPYSFSGTKPARA